jgi:hypothetical protein
MITTATAEFIGAKSVTFNQRKRRPMFTPIDLHVTIRRPLLPVAVCCAFANQDREAVLNAITSGDLAYAFDIRSPDAGKPAIRVLATSLQNWIAGRRLPANTDTPASLLKIVSDLFPCHAAEREPRVTTANMERILGTTHTHLFRLARLGLIKIARPPRIGRAGCALFDRRSVVQFLMQRRMV